MGKDKHKSGEEESTAEKGRKEHKSKRRADDGSESEYDSVDGSRRSGGSKQGKSKKKMSRSSKRRRSGSKYSDDSYSSDSYSDSEDLYSESDSGSSEYSESDSGSESEEERRRRKRRERMKREEREKERRRKRKREKEKRRRNKEKEEEIRKKKKKDKKKAKDKGKTGAVTNSWGKYGIIRETDMWNKRPEFTAWLAEVKQVNLESLPNWEEKQMFKVFMEDHNTATFPSKKYYDLDVYYRRKMEKEMKKGFKKVVDSERIVFNDEEQRRRELLEQREKHKEEQLETLKRSMQGGMAQAMKEQARLREEMAYQYKLGNFEAAAAIQRRLDPDVAM